MKAPIIRRLLKDKAFFLREYPNTVVIAAFNHFINGYRSRVGKATYLSQMLGDVGLQPADQATFYDSEGMKLELKPMAGETIYDLLKRVEPLPFVVRWARQERYL